MMRKKAIKGIVFVSVAVLFVSASLFLLRQSIGCGGWSGFFKNLAGYAYASPYADTSAGACQTSYETYSLAGAYVMVPSKGGKEQSQRFSGYEVYEYFYPANPEKNNEDRKKLYSFNSNGSIEVSGNLVVNGTKTSLYNEYGSGSMGISSYDITTKDQKNVREVISFTPRSPDVVINGGAVLNFAWDPNDDQGVGPSVFMGGEGAEYLMSDGYGISGTRKDVLIETSFLKTEDDYLWEEYFGYDSLHTLSAPSAFFYKKPFFYVADNGNRRILRYNTSDIALDKNKTTVLAGGKETAARYAMLGAKDWDWQINGIAVDDKGLIFVSDSANNTVIKTNISGSVWESAYHSIDRYQSRLFLDGSENMKALDVVNLRELSTTSTFADDRYLFAQGLEIADCGYNNQKVVGVTRNPHWDKGYYTKGWFEIDETTGKPEMQESEDCVFGGSCFYFNGDEYLALPDQAAWNLEDDFFIMDLWVNFDSVASTSALITHEESFFFEWKPENASSSSTTAEKLASMQNSTLNFSFMSEERDANGRFINQSFQHKWLPKVGEWYHLTVIRNENNYLQMFVDEELLSTSTPITGTLRDGGGVLEIGGYSKNKVFNGKMDNIRIARGRTKWDLDQAGRYFFNEPKGLVVVEDNIYVVDSGHGRIVRTSKDFKNWAHFGEIGSGKYQFFEPTDIYYHGGFFYITDTGNKRVIKTNLQTMSEEMKGEYSGSWEVVYSSDSPGLTGIYVDNSERVITDSYNGTVLRNGVAVGSKNPSDNLFKLTSPMDVMKDEEGNYLILDGTSKYDQGTQVFGRALEIYGTDQPDDLNVKFNLGGLKSKTFVTNTLMSQQGGSGSGEWESWSTNGPGVSHCPDIDNDDEGFNGSCPGGGVWLGEGQGINCTNSSDPDVEESSCKGQWDWSAYWPSCVYYEPEIEYVENCSGETCVNDCKTVCSPVTYDCKVGNAVVTSDADVDGPPDWAPKSAPGSKTGPDAKGGAPYSECQGLGPDNNGRCSWTSSHSSLKLPSEKTIEKKIITLTQNLHADSKGVDVLVDRIRAEGYIAYRLASSTLRYHEEYTREDLRFTDSCYGTYPVRDGFIMVRDGYMFKIFRVVSAPSYESHIWSINHVPVAWLDHDIWRGERLDCSLTLGGAECPTESICGIKEAIAQSEQGLAPAFTSLDTLIHKLNTLGYDAKRISASRANSYQPTRADENLPLKSDQEFRDSCNNKAMVNDFFIEVDSSLYRVLRRGDSTYEWMSEYTYFSDLMDDIKNKDQNFKDIDGTCDDEGPANLSEITEWRDSADVSSWPIKKYLTVEYGLNNIYFDNFYDQGWKGDGENCASIIVIFMEDDKWVAQNTDYLQCGNAKKFWTEPMQVDSRFKEIEAGDCVGYMLAPMKARNSSSDVPDPSQRTNVYMTSWLEEEEDLCIDGVKSVYYDKLIASPDNDTASLVLCPYFSAEDECRLSTGVKLTYAGVGGSAPQQTYKFNDADVPKKFTVTCKNECYTFKKDKNYTGDCAGGPAGEYPPKTCEVDGQTKTGNDCRGNDPVTGYHHYTPVTIVGANSNAIVLCPGEKGESCSVNGSPMHYHGQDIKDGKGRDVWVGSNVGLSGNVTVTCNGISWNISHNPAGGFVYGTCN